MYKITDRQAKNADRLKVIIRPSKNSKKKIDVYDLKGNKLVSIGAAGYMDYDLYIKNKGLAYANERRRLYKIRHSADRTKKGSAGYYADQILW
jgi:hypothetical protein